MQEVKRALVVEGGGMRGIFTAGVLDAFLQERFNPFNLFIGVSAGAVSIASYLSGQYQRYYRLSSTGP
jgi:predicted patatin/cPLA2 family phospholipase